MYHTLAYTVSLGTTADTDVPAISDGIMAIANSHFLPQRDYDVVYAYVGSAGVNRARLVSPSNRQITLPFLRPVGTALLPGAEPRVYDARDNPFRIRGLEELAIEATTDTSPGPEQFIAVLGLRPAFVPAPAGNIFTLRGTSTTAAVARTWTQLSVTWANQLPAGLFATVGLNVIATNSIAARMTFENQVLRPGAICTTTSSARQHAMFVQGGLGDWGHFTSTRMPIVEVLNNSTDASHVVYMDLVRIG